MKPRSVNESLKMHIFIKTVRLSRQTGQFSYYRPFSHRNHGYFIQHTTKLIFFYNSSAIRTMWPILLIPIIPVILKHSIIVFGMQVFITLWPKIHWSYHLFVDPILDILFIWIFLASVWAIRFLGALTEIAFAGAIATWYWTFKKQMCHHSPCSKHYNYRQH